MDPRRDPAGAALDLRPGAASAPTASSGPRGLVLDLFGEYLRFGSAEVGLGELSRLMGAFGVTPPTVRMTVTRLRRDGWFTSERRGRETTYRLSASMQRVLEDGRQRIFNPPPEQSSGEWTMVTYQLSEDARTEREQLRRRLSGQGFGALGTSTWLAPGDRRPLARELTRGLAADHLEILGCRSDGLEHDRALARRCWDLDELAKEYQDFIGRATASAPSARDLRGPAALVERTNLVADFRRLPFKDPLLPRDLCPAPWPGAAAYELFSHLHRSLGPAARAHVADVVGRAVHDTVTVSLRT